MSKLDDLTKLVASALTKEGATPDEIKQQVEIEKLIEDAKDEEKKLLDSNAELVKAYKELVNSTAGKKKPDDENTFKEVEVPTFEEALKNWGNGFDILGQEQRK